MRTQATTHDDADLMTAQGFERLQRELDHLRAEGRQQVAERLRDARLDAGDPAENGELTDALDEQQRLEQRIRTIEARLACARIVEPGTGGGEARIGTHVRLVGSRTGVIEFTLVGAGEADLSSGRVSIASPIGQAVAGRRSGDTIDVQTPRRRLWFQVVSVRSERAVAGIERLAA